LSRSGTQKVISLGVGDLFIFCTNFRANTAISIKYDLLYIGKFRRYTSLKAIHQAH